jgi:hypothetical protein
MAKVRSLDGSVLISAAQTETEWQALRWGRPHVDAGRTVLIEAYGREFSFQELNQMRASAGLPCA